MKILLATDGSEYGFEAARKCCRMISEEDHPTIRIISVIESITPVEPFGTSDEYYVLAQQAARRVAEDIVEDTRRTMREILGDRKIDIETRTVSGQPKVAIVEEAQNWGADLIVVGSQGRGFWSRMLLGSVSDAIVNHAPCNVLVVR
jgi:nucleotide-binding universal stress UspA family protein